MNSRPLFPWEEAALKSPLWLLDHAIAQVIRAIVARFEVERVLSKWLCRFLELAHSDTSLTVGEIKSRLVAEGLVPESVAEWRLLWSACLEIYTALFDTERLSGREKGLILRYQHLYPDEIFDIIGRQIKLLPPDFDRCKLPFARVRFKAWPKVRRTRMARAILKGWKIS